ncbi:MAG: type II toxin-antitoxin system Phd/YefM family antitoxin [Acidobacteriota bacterium]
MTRLGITEVRKVLPDAINRVAYTRERVVISRNGKDVAALVPMEDLELLRKLEDRHDLDALRKALSEPGETPDEKVWRALGI